MTSVVGLWRYPVKSMAGETCTNVTFGPHGVAGDRRYAFVDALTGKVASAKNPRLWPTLLGFSARYVAAPGTNGVAAPIEIQWPDGSRIASEDAQLDAAMARTLGRAVRLSSSAPPAPMLEEYRPDRDDVVDDPMPASTFFDCATVHLLTVNTLDALAKRYPSGDFSIGRFRPNVLLSAEAGTEFAEDAWIGKTVRIGSSVVLRVTGATTRCVMTTLAQGELPADPGVLRTAAAHHDARVGVYADVVSGGSVGLGDPLVVAP